MYGHLFVVFRNFIVDRHGGTAAWEKIMSQADCDGDFEDTADDYDDEMIDDVIKAAIDIIGLPREPFLQMFGEFYLDFMREKGYGQILQNLGANILEFLQNLDSVHCRARNEYPDIVAPSFRCDDDSVEDNMVLHFYSARKGLQSMVKGFTVSAAKIFYKMQLKMDVLSTTMETVSTNQEREREHVTFSINACKIKEQTEEGPPTFIAQTRKHCENQILKEDVEEVRRKLEKIKEELGEDALPLTKKRSARGKWRMAARITAMHKGFVPNYPATLAVNPRMFIEIFPYHLIVDTELKDALPLTKKRSARGKWRMAARITAMHKGFVPNYPVTLAVNPRMFIDIFPYHLIVDTELKVVQAGIKIQMMMPAIRSRQALVADFFEMRYPNDVELTYVNIEHFIMTPHVLELKAEQMDKEWITRPAFQLKGQMFLLRDSGFFIYVASPLVPGSSFNGLESQGMKLAAVPAWDVTRDLLFVDTEHKKRSGGGGGGRQVVVVAGGGAASGNSGDGHQLEKVRRDLENERRKNTALYQAFLPKDAIDLVNRKQVPSGEYHTEATALFCDVVQFLPMVARCRPREVVELLNKLQNKFDKVTKQHKTNRVESVGDAYLVVAGMESERGRHAERTADTALDMLTVAGELASPLDGEPVMIRIGVHTGTFVTGVLGNRVPRYVVMGETSVVASKLESHGLPGKIHTSPTTYRMLENKGYVFEERGGVEIRGFGCLETYFLLCKGDVIDADDVERKPTVNFVSETSGVSSSSPFQKRNKIDQSPENKRLSIAEGQPDVGQVSPTTMPALQE